MTSDEPWGLYPGQPRYFVGADQARTFRERIQEIHANNREIAEAMAELDEYFSDPDFTDRLEVRRFIGWVARSIEEPRMAEGVAGEVVNQGYITALKRLGYRDASLAVAFSRDFAKEHRTSLVAAFMFGPSGAARMALADWLVEEKLHGMYRPGMVAVCVSLLSIQGLVQFTTVSEVASQTTPEGHGLHVNLDFILLPYAALALAVILTLLLRWIAGRFRERRAKEPDKTTRRKVR